ncbi:MAG: SMC family ATPase [Negativicutes bacterium]|nr:SMC family ATPase [Negativicutes bacterium]
MRPLRLSMTAFGPYAGCETVDFRLLGDSAFFLIHGPTGAGKTAILDAMCFALFGKTSGDIRDGRQMRSDFVGADVVTEVSFDFALGGENYRIHRSPEQEVVKKRGAGTTTAAAGATLWKRTGLGDDTEEGSVVASRWEKVTQAVENLLGFKFEQFRQVVLLPQGEFRRLLLASSRDREAILETLFQTEEYRRIEEYFKQQAKELAEKIRELDARKKWTLEQAGVGAVDELSAGLAADEAQAKNLAAAAMAAGQALQAAREQLAAVNILRSQFEERRQAEALLAELAIREPLVAGKKQEHAAALQAVVLAELAEQVQGRDSERKQAELALEKAAAGLNNGLQAAEQAARLFLLEQEHQPERDETAESVRRLSEAQEKLQQLINAREDLAKAGVAAQAAQESCERCKLELQAAAGQLEATRLEREAVRDEASQLALRQTAWQEAERNVKHRAKLDELREKYAVSAKKEKAVRGQLAAAEETLATARREFTAAQSEWRQGQAAQLAGELEDGRPCPVCGSEHHPAPARGAVLLVSTADLKAREQSLEKLEKDLDIVRRRAGDAAVELEGARVEGQSQSELLGDLAKAPLEDLQAMANTAKAAFAAAQAAVDRLKKIDQNLAQLETTVNALKNGLEENERIAGQQKADCEAAKAVVDERERAVPVELRVPEHLAAALKEAQVRRDRLQQAFEQAREAAQVSAREVEGLKATRSAAAAALSAAQDKLAGDRDKLLQRVGEAGFAGIEDFTAALRPAGTIEALAREIKNHEETKLLAEDRLNRVAAVTAGLIEPDPAAAVEAVHQAEVVANDLIAAQARLAENIGKRREWLAELGRISGELAGREGEYAVLGRMSEVANGHNQERLSFHRFVLAALLDDVMLAANARLKTMSRGRYILRRMTDPLHRGAAGGLDIEIEDNYTGAARHVGTLSGGETFLASLALALGLADVVQSYSGGIYLDTIFVDEGFGTLDPESLDMAVQALVELQHKGRLVGIISHVPELRERIEARLEIVPTELGSTTRWSALPFSC